MDFLLVQILLFSVDWMDSLLRGQYIGLAGIIVAVVVALIFYIRDEGIKRQYKRLKVELDGRMQEIINQEKQIDIQKGKLQQQIELSDKQNSLIHEQAVELDKNRHALEKKVDLRTLELMEAKERAEQSDKLKTAFLENISHEIRTPMNAIIGFASLMSYHNLGSSEQEKYIKLINKNCLMLLDFIDSVIDVSKVKSGQLNVSKSSFSVNKLLLSIEHDLRAENEMLDRKQLKLELKLPKRKKDYFLYSDASRVKQVIKNLLSNAVKYTEKGGISFGYQPLFDSDFEKDPSALQFFVEDTGIGITDQKSDYIFNWFNKIDDHKDQVFRGAGMGLFLSKEIVILLGGKMWFNSRVDEGSTFYFRLPFLNTEIEPRKVAKPSVPKIGEKELPTDYNWKGKTILIVEDESNNVVYLKEIIRRTGASILEATNGTKAVETVRKEPEISLILMDIMMPEMDGYEATRRIKKIKSGIPVIAQTAYTKAREKEKSLEAGCEGYISKPYDPPALLKLIDQFI